MNKFGVSTNEVLKDLKAFQLKTTNYAFDRMYGKDATSRFLVADEVGLGKTLIARGVIAKVCDHHEKLGDKRIDIVYICSNAAIASQNLRKLNIADESAITHADRLTTLTAELATIHEKPINLIAITPGTSFDLNSSTGKFSERALVYALLKRVWGVDALKGSGAERVFFRGIADNRSAGRRLRREADGHTVPSAVVKSLREAIRDCDAKRKSEGKRRLRILFRDLADSYRYKKSHYPDSLNADRIEFIAELRRLLAQVALDALEPDLVILDEFQRFKHLLDSDSNEWSTQLAQQLFSFEEKASKRKTRTLLLSATPYRPYTTTADGQGDDHYEDFLATVRFLYSDADKTEELRSDLRSLRQEMLSITPKNLEPAEELCARISERLQPVMARTERLASTSDRSGMLKSVPSNLSVERSDITGFVSAARVAEVLGQGDITEYWKSSPYLLNFMENYVIKNQFREAVNHEAVNGAMANVLKRDRGQLDWKAIQSYRRIDPSNARLRMLIEDTVGRDMWRLLWLPPALRYYDAGGIFETEAARKFTKRLVFSAWNVVPKAISTLTSYEAERMALRSAPAKVRHGYTNFSKRSSNLLDFAVKSGEPLSMTHMCVITPHPSLASSIDPLKLSAKLRGAGEAPSVTLVRKAVASMIEVNLSDEMREVLDAAPKEGSVDQNWYWATPLLMDLQRFATATREWWDSASIESWIGTPEGTEVVGSPSSEASKLFARHIERIQGFARDPHAGIAALGRVPNDLFEVLTDIALASPAVCAHRALCRACTEPQPFESASIIDGASRIAWGFRSMFSGALETAVVRSAVNNEAYWRAVLTYGVIGNMQSMLDEYVHTARDWIGGSTESFDKATADTANTIHDALSIRTVNYASDLISVEDGKVRLDPSPQLRARFAISLQQKSDDPKATNRVKTVRTAFNSPFWPFVLASTSIGQEGLDFHLYSHAVVHWNLPSNPVDFEQREGRVHRFKGHAVRKNVASDCADAAFGAISDPWQAMFESAARKSDDADEIRPYWVYDEGNSPARIERYVPTLPLSKDVARLSKLLESVAAYRLSIGQPRQEELVELLTGRLNPEELSEVSSRLRIELSPNASAPRPTTE